MPRREGTPKKSDRMDVFMYVCVHMYMCIYVYVYLEMLVLSVLRSYSQLWFPGPTSDVLKEHMWYQGSNQHKPHSKQFTPIVSLSSTTSVDLTHEETSLLGILMSKCIKSSMGHFLSRVWESFRMLQLSKYEPWRLGGGWQVIQTP